MKKTIFVSTLASLFLFCGLSIAADDLSPPSSPVKLVFIHHSCGENWLADYHGRLGIALRDNNYFVSDTNYGWPPDSIGDNTDIGHWCDWFVGENSAAYTSALYAESDRFGDYYSRLSTDPGGENRIVMFKSCYPNSYLYGPANAAAAVGDNPLRGQPSWSEHMTVANAKGIYNGILGYFATRQDKLFIAVTAPPQVDGETDATIAANARAFNDWLVNDWLAAYPYDNVAAFDFYNVLTSNGGSPEINDAGDAEGNHHRWHGGQVQHIQTVEYDMAAYASGDSHPTEAGNLKATQEFPALLNVYYHRWVDGGEQPDVPSASTGAASAVSVTSATLNATVDSADEDLTCRFEWGTDTEYGNVTENQLVAAGSPATTVSATIDGLASGTSYHFRVVAVHSGGTIAGADKSFTTSGGAASSHLLYFPHTVSDDYWETEICVVHTGDGVIDGEFKCYDGEGRMLGEPLQVVVDPNGRTQKILGWDFPDPINTRYVVFESESEDVVGYAKFFTDGKYRAAIPAVSEINSGTIYASHIASDQDWGTGMALVNTNDYEASPTIVFDNGETVDFTIPAGGYYLTTVRQLFNRIKPDIESAEIRNAEGVIGLELFVDADKNLLSGILLKDDTATEIFFPHVAVAGGWGTGIVAYNTSDQECDMQVTSYDAAGQVLGTVNEAIPAKQRYFGSVSALGLPGGIAWIDIEASQPITGFELFTQTNQLAGYTGVNIAGTRGVFPKIEKEGDTGIAFVNAEDEAASVALTCYDDAGEVVAQEIFELAPRQKEVRQAAAFFSSDISSGTYVAYESDRRIVGFQLNLSSDRMMLDALPGLRSDASCTGAETAQWTYMVYLSGDNNLSQEAFGDINEMETVGSTPEVNIVAQVEFSSAFSPGLDSYGTMRGKIVADAGEYAIGSRLEDIGQLDMGKKKTLTDFIVWAKENHPARRYALVLWDHGEGWKSAGDGTAGIKGALEDSTSASFMTLPDLADAVEESGLHLDVVNFDACLMAMYEVAFEFAGLVDYMVFSQEVESDDGDPYDVILKKLVDEPGMAPAQLAELVATEYANFYRSLKTSVATKSAVDMSRIPALHESLCDLARTLNENMNTERPAIQAARDESLRFDFPENHDLGDFLNLLADKKLNDTILSKIETVREALERAVIRNEAYSPAPVADIDRAEGLAIFLPRRGETTDMDLANYSLLAINRNRSEETATWGNFVNLLVTGEETLPSGPLAKVPGNFSIWLTWDTDADLDLIVREPDGDYAAPYHGTSSDNGFFVPGFFSVGGIVGILQRGRDRGAGRL